MQPAWVPDSGSQPNPLSEICIGEVKVNGALSGAAVSIGTALLAGAFSQNKRTIGCGKLCGDHPAAPSLGGILYDPDLIDFPVHTDWVLPDRRKEGQ